MITNILFFRNCQCRFGIADAHTMRSGDMVKLTHGEASQMFVMEDQSGRSYSDLRRTSQVFPGSIIRRLWSVMFSPTTSTCKYKTIFESLLFNAEFFYEKKHFYDPFYSVPLRELVHTGTLPLRFHKLVFTIGGEPESLNETKLFVTIKVSILILIFSDC